MNISNEILFKAVTAFVDTIADVIAEEVAAKVTARLDRMDKLIEDTLNNTKPILENMNGRQERLQTQVDAIVDRFDDITTASDERVEQIATRQIENALENYDPSDALDYSDLAHTILDSYTFQDGLKDAIKELNFTVEVH